MKSRRTKSTNSSVRRWQRLQVTCMVLAASDDNTYTMIDCFNTLLGKSTTTNSTYENACILAILLLSSNYCMLANMDQVLSWLLIRVSLWLPSVKG
jgi:hypothetical protein